MKPSESECLAKWRELLARFSVLVENNSSPDKIQKELLQLKSEVQNTNLLNYRQKDMLQSRICNVLSGRFSGNKPNDLNSKAS